MLNDRIILMLKKLQTVLEIEKKRYEKKGPVNTIVGLFLYFGVMWAAWTIGKAYWPSHIEDKASFVLICGMSIYMFAQILSFSIFMPGYFGWSNYYAERLINKKASQPWKRKNWPQMLSKTIKYFVLNQLIIYPIAIYLSNLNGARQRFDNFPEYKELLWQIYVIYLVDDFFFYWGHRIFHMYPSFYKYHKIHHEYDTLFTLVDIYFHPLDLIFGNMLPALMPFLIFGDKVHVFTFFFYNFWKVMNTAEGHAGYDIEWLPMRILPFSSAASYHDHHHSVNIGNFSGNCYFWDLIFDTNELYLKEYLKN